MHAPITISDLNRTWEGDNNVLMQQACRLLLKNLSNLLTGHPLMPTVEFLRPDAPEPETFKGSLSNLKDLLRLLTFKAETLIHENGIRMQLATDKVGEWDKSLTYHLYPMTFAYFDRFIVANYLEFLNKLKSDEATFIAYERMGIIFAQKAILEDAEFYRDVLSREDIIELKEDIMAQLKLLRVDAVAMTYTLHFRDNMLGAFGHHDLNIYQNFINQVEHSQNEYSRPDEWQYLYK